MAKDDKDKVWNVYFRLPSDNGEWQFEGFVPQTVLETFDMDGETFPGDRWHNYQLYNHDGEFDLGEGLAAQRVHRNLLRNIESRYELGKPGNGLIKRTGKATSVTFNCKLYR